MMRKLFVIILVMLCSLSSSIIFADDAFEKEVIDSAIINQNFAFALYKVTGTTGINRGNQAQQLIIYCKGQPSMFTTSKKLQLHNFNTSEMSDERIYARDINKDGHEEIIILGHTGLGSCCYHLALHTLQDSMIVDLGTFELDELSDYQLKDIDNDSIPEILFHDTNYLKWHAPFSDSPRPILIFKWRDGKYQAANYKFSDYLLKQITKDDYSAMESAIKRRVEKEYDANHEYFRYPPPELWGMMLNYIYADKNDKAEAILNQYWPKEIPGKAEFYDEFQVKIKESEYWPELIKSKW